MPQPCMASVASAFCALGHLWAPCVAAPHPEQTWRTSCFGVVHPSSLCQAVHNCFPSLAQRPLRMRSAKVSNFLSHVCLAEHSMVRCGCLPRQTAQQGNGPVPTMGRTVRTFLLLDKWSSAGVCGRFCEAARYWGWAATKAAAACCSAV